MSQNVVKLLCLHFGVFQYLSILYFFHLFPVCLETLLSPDLQVLSLSFFYPLPLKGEAVTSVSVTTNTLFHHKVQHTHTHSDPPAASTSCLIQTCLMSPLTDPHRVGSTHAHRHSITAQQRGPRINPSCKASSRPFPMRMRCPEARSGFIWALQRQECDI